MVERLTLFRVRSNNKLPTRILVYRDGVSEVSSTSFCWSTMLSFPLPYRDNS